MRIQNTWLEVSLNGAYPKALQPNGPHEASQIIEEGIACSEAGAAIVHFHAFEDDTDQQVYDADTYHRIIAGIRKYSDALVYGTVPMIGGFAGAKLLTPEERYRPTESLLKAGILDCFVIDAGLVNFASYDGISSSDPAKMYLNPVNYLRYAMELAKEYDVNPTCGIWEAGFLRTASALAEACNVRRPIMYKLVLTDSMTFGLPAEIYALNTYKRLQQQFAPNASLMLSAVGTDTFHLIPDALTMGIHVRVGMEDAKPACEFTNLELVTRAVTAIRQANGDLESPSAIRIALRPAA